MGMDRGMKGKAQWIRECKGKGTGNEMEMGMDRGMEGKGQWIRE